jgi:protein-tyrosine phosphatase
VIDTHCHLLPGIDDGSRSVEQSVSVLRAFAAQGVTDVILTPHLNASMISAGADAALGRRERALAALLAEAPAAPRLQLGFEIMLDQPLPTLALGDRRFSLARSRYYLVEFPLGIVPQFAVTVLQQMARAGAIPIVAHPERYQACSPAAVAAWRGAGARIQLDATTLTRPTTRGKRARALLAAGLGDIVAADNHGDRRSVATAVRYLEPHAPPDVIERLSRDNPAAIVHDGDMQAVSPIAVQERWIDRLTGLLRGD